MDFALSEAHRLIQQTARRVARDVVAPRAAAVDEASVYPHDYFQAFQEVGLLGTTLPSEYGGADAGMLGMAVAIEEVAKYCCSAGLILLLSALPARAILLYGSDEQRLEILPAIADGSIKCCFALTEPDSGSDAGALRTAAVRDGDDWLLSGEKAYISGATEADVCVVWANTEPGSGPRGVRGFLVETSADGFSIPRTDRKMGVRGVPTGHLHLDNVRVSADRMLGGRADDSSVPPVGFRCTMETLNSVRPLVGARALGLAQGACAYALEFARERQVFGAPLIELQAIQFKFAEMAIKIESARLLVYQAAQRVDDGLYRREDAHMLSIAKAYATEVANQIASEALQVLGAQGYMQDHPLERHYRDARQLMIVEGTSEIQRVLISRAMIERNLVYA